MWFGYIARLSLFIWRLPAFAALRGSRGGSQHPVVRMVYTVGGCALLCTLYRVEHIPLYTSTYSLSLLQNTLHFKRRSADYSHPQSDSFGNFLDSTFLYMYVLPPGHSFSQGKTPIRSGPLALASLCLQVYYRPVATTFAAWPAVPICLEMPASHEGHSTWKIKCIF